jgi:hypothetical protein
MAKIGKIVKHPGQYDNKNISGMYCYFVQGTKPSTVNVAGAGIFQDKKLPV